MPLPHSTDYGEDVRLIRVEMSAEFLFGELVETIADREKRANEGLRFGREGAAVRILAADLGFHELLAEGPFGLFDAAPDVAIAFTELLCRLLNRAGPLDRLQHLAEAEAKSVVALGFQPNFDARDERRGLPGSSGPGAGHGRSFAKNG